MARWRSRCTSQRSRPWFSSEMMLSPSSSELVNVRSMFLNWWGKAKVSGMPIAEFKEERILNIPDHANGLALLLTLLEALSTSKCASQPLEECPGYEYPWCNADKAEK